jgi:hypothetical protein
MHKTSCGPSGTHTRLCGDMLAHRRPHVHDTSLIQGNTPSNNQKPVHGSKGPLPDLGTHLAVTQTKGDTIGADPGSADPTLRRFAPIFHVLSPRWILSAFRGCSGCSRVNDLAYIYVEGEGLEYGHTISPKDESFTSKERPLLGRLENRRVREGFISLWMLRSSFRIQ